MYRTIRGFTLIEMLVSVAVFSMVMLVGTSALLTLVSQNQRAQSLNSVITDLNFTLESMARTIRTGYQYGCNFSAGSDCPSGSNRFQMVTLIDDDEYRVLYRFREVGERGFIERRLIPLGSGTAQNWTEITSTNVDIEEFDFFVFGANNSDQFQPRVMIALSGTADSGEETSEFAIQTTVTQRLIDL